MTITETTMPAWAQAHYGPASGTVLTRIAIPEPGRGEVLLRVHATALNAGDVRLLLGDPLIVRTAFGVMRPRNPVRGMDVSGTIVAVGEAAAGFRVGDEVVTELPGGGGLAPYAIAPASRLVTRPGGLDAAAAACLPIAGGTAWQALDAAGITAGGRVLILGASGGVGTFAVQLARLRGAEVHATCSERNRRLVESLGAAHIVDRDRPLGDLPAGGYDAVIDIVGGSPLRSLQRLVRPRGTVVLAAGVGGRVLGPLPRLLRAALLGIGSRRRIRPLAATAKPEILRGLLELAAAGGLSPVIEKELPFADAVAALAHVEGGHTVGKVVVRAAP